MYIFILPDHLARLFQVAYEVIHLVSGTGFISELEETELESTADEARDKRSHEFSSIESDTTLAPLLTRYGVY